MFTADCSRGVTLCVTMQEDRARAEALLFFNGKHTNGASTNGSVDDSEVLDPALQELMTSIDTLLEGLQKQVTQLNDCLKVRLCLICIMCHAHRLAMHCRADLTLWL